MLDLENAMVTIPKKRIGQFVKSIKQKITELEKEELRFTEEKTQFLYKFKNYVEAADKCVDAIKEFKSASFTKLRVLNIDYPDDAEELFQQYLKEQSEQFKLEHHISILRVGHVYIEHDSDEGTLVITEDINIRYSNDCVLSKASWNRAMNFAQLEELENELFVIVSGYVKTRLNGEDTPDFLERVQSLYTLNTGPYKDQLKEAVAKLETLANSSVESLTVKLTDYEFLEQVRQTTIKL